MVQDIAVQAGQGVLADRRRGKGNALEDPFDDRLRLGERPFGMRIVGGEDDAVDIPARRDRFRVKAPASLCAPMATSSRTCT